MARQDRQTKWRPVFRAAKDFTGFDEVKRGDIYYFLGAFSEERARELLKEELASGRALYGWLERADG